MAPWPLLDQVEEDAIHRARLLNVEEKTFKRITKRLLDPNGLVAKHPVLPPTPPLDTSAADEEAAAKEQSERHQADERRNLRGDVHLDFAAFESGIVRIQLLLNSNFKERERYANEKIQIEQTAQDVRNNTADLRVNLEQAQRTLALRKEYDELAETITSNRQLKPREEQHHNIEKLKSEIAELERESLEYAQTWSERRDQFGKIIEEGMQLRRLIRDEKEEVERREGMEGQEEGEGDHKGGSSGVNTPRPETNGGATPMHMNDKDGETGMNGLTTESNVIRGSSALRDVQLPDEHTAPSEEVKEDEEMAEDGELEAEPEGTTAAPVEGLVSMEGDRPAPDTDQETMDVT